MEESKNDKRILKNLEKAINFIGERGEDKEIE